MSWHYLAEQEGVSSVACCTGGEPLRPLRSKTIHAEFYCNGKLTRSYLDSLSGTTYEPSTDGSGRGKSTSSPEASPARTSQLQGLAPASEGQSQDCGTRWIELFEKYNLNTSSSRIQRCCSGGGSSISSIVSTAKASVGRLRYFQRCLSQKLTSETGYSFLPTPRAADGNGSGALGRERRKWNLTDWVRHRFGVGPVHPELTELAMGFPIGWTDLKPLATRNFRQWLHSRGRN